MYIYCIRPQINKHKINKHVVSEGGERQLGWASCLTSAGRVALASGTTFLHINTLARLTGITLGVASVT